MFHNLKVLRSIAFAHKFGGNHSATLSPNRLSAHFLLRHSSTSAPTTTPTKCWQCGSSHSPTGGIQFQCTKCQSLLDVPGQVNHFDLFAVDRIYRIDATQLQQRFREMQSVLHPDKFSQKSDTEQNLSAEWSSLVNKAYKVLQSPIQRAEYLLNLQNVTIPEGNTAVGNEFLMEMMERNEEVEEANTREELVDLLQRVHGDCVECEHKLEKSLMANELEAAKALVITMRYLISLENSIKEKGNRIGVFL